MIELGFISNRVDNELFDTRLGEYAQAIVKGISDAFGITPMLYRVQAGAFRNRENAENLLRRVQVIQPDAFIVRS
jgi:hypothetical protein